MVGIHRLLPGIQNIADVLVSIAHELRYWLMFCETLQTSHACSWAMRISNVVMPDMKEQHKPC